MISLKEKLGHQFVVTCELDPPRGADPEKTLAEARAVASLVDAVNVSDSPQANLRMTPIVAAHLVQSQIGLEAIAHFTCRDRNVLGLQAELLGAHALGVYNILCLHGDPPERGDHPEAKGIFEVDAVGLARIAKTLNQGKAKSGRELEGKTNLHVAVAANPGAKDLQRETMRFFEKVEAGADFAQTQPVYEIETVETFLNTFGGKPPIPVLYGVLPIRSLEMAERVSKWTHVPQQLMDDLKEKGREAGLEWSKRIVKDLRALGVDGVHLYPLGRPSAVEQILS
jgi:5,10-methylenetetrahydrofolate reductase